SQVAAFMSTLRAIDGTASLALQWTILTAARTGEVLKARAGEVDWEKQIWTIPKGHTKTKEKHVVPLPDAAMAILEKLGDRKPDEPLFPIHGSAMLLVAQSIKPGIVTHGFRATFKTFAAESTEFPKEVREACLSHKVGTEVDLAYHMGPQF